MKFQEELQRTLDENKDDLRAVRSALQYVSSGMILPPELVDAVKKFDKSDIKCPYNPDLLTIIDPSYYEQHRQELYDPVYRLMPPVFLTHCGELPKLKFEGIRGILYFVDSQGRHAEFVDMDSTDYFAGLSEEEREDLAWYFVDNHPLSKRSHKPYENHIATMQESYVVFGNIDRDLSYRIIKTVRVK